MTATSILSIILGLLALGLLVYGLYRIRDKTRFTIGVRQFVLIISFLMGALSLWLVVGAHINPERVGWIFFGVNLFTFLYTAVEPLTSKAFKQRIMNSQAVMTGRQLIIQSMAGIVTGVLIILLSGITGFTIAVPQVSFSVAGDGFLQFLTTVFIAPLSEEPFFLVVIPSFLTLCFFVLFGDKVWALGASLITSSVIFSMFHWYAYGASLSLAIGAFTGAAIFRFLMLTIELVKEGEFSVTAGSRTLAVTIPAHMVFNGFIYGSPLFIAGRGAG